MSDSRFPKLRNLLGSYFYQDWDDDYDWQGETPNFNAVVRFYKANNPPATVAQATKELQQFLTLQLDEGDLKAALADIGVFYSPQADGMTRRQWLEQVLAILQEPTTNSNLRFVA